jgi:hypothetical protein
MIRKSENRLSERIMLRRSKSNQSGKLKKVGCAAAAAASFVS